MPVIFLMFTWCTPHQRMQITYKKFTMMITNNIKILDVTYKMTVTKNIHPEHSEDTDQENPEYPETHVQQGNKYLSGTRTI
ncbi:unnamed protein product [Cuscuta campestris]|uniref:Uncharacterized protein n=1 Tax=Cuscuta campestris TaxID=132261 RepID=A0A484KX42_9ASTE|nr:unnamed protein product [Cuscuta campestris]